MQAPVLESPDQLRTRRDDVFAALRALERDRDDGVIDGEAYEVARRRFEIEAATLLEKLDALETQPARPASFTRARPSRVLVVASLVAVLAAITVLLLAAVHARSTGGTVTGGPPPGIATPVPAPPTGLVAAQRRVRLHPRDVNALLDLGALYLRTNDTARADRAFVAAMRLDPSRPEPPTMHALILGSTDGRVALALSLLSGAERAHRGYARAWLVDGLLSSKGRATRARAIHAYQRFLALQRRGSVAAEVRALLAALERKGGKG